MIGPSPDWFIGVHNVELCVDGSWVNEPMTLDLMGYDCGCRIGDNF